MYHESRGQTFIYCWDIIQCILWHLLAIKIEQDTTVQLEFGDNLLQISRNTELTETEMYEYLQTFNPGLIRRFKVE